MPIRAHAASPRLASLARTNETKRFPGWGHSVLTPQPPIIIIMIITIITTIIIIIRRPLWGKRRCETVALDLRSSVSGLELQL